MNKILILNGAKPYPRARSHYWAGVGVSGLDHFKAWFARIDAGPTTQAALRLPKLRPSVLGVGNTETAASATNYKE